MPFNRYPQTRLNTTPPAYGEPILTPKELAAHRGCTPGSLANMRRAGKGPRYFKLGRGGPVRYRWGAVVDDMLGVDRGADAA